MLYHPLKQTKCGDMTVLVHLIIHRKPSKEQIILFSMMESEREICRRCDITTRRSTGFAPTQEYGNSTTQHAL